MHKTIDKGFQMYYLCHTLPEVAGDDGEHRGESTFCSKQKYLLFKGKVTFLPFKSRESPNQKEGSLITNST